MSELNPNKNMLKSYRICPDCDYFCNILEKDKYCSLCGSLLIDKCKKCGCEISNPYAHYCKCCGEAYKKKVHKRTNLVRKKI